MALDRIGKLRFDGTTVSSLLAPYPRHVDYDAATGTATLTAVFSDPVVCNRDFRRCDISVANFSRHSRTSRDTVPRPVCFTDAAGPSAVELGRWIRVAMRGKTADTFMVFFVPASATTDAFCVLVVDTPWVAMPSVVCPGCGDWFPLRRGNDEFDAHIGINQSTPPPCHRLLHFLGRRNKHVFNGGHIFLLLYTYIYNNNNLISLSLSLSLSLFLYY